MKDKILTNVYMCVVYVIYVSIWEFFSFENLFFWICNPACNYYKQICSAVPGKGLEVLLIAVSLSLKCKVLHLFSFILTFLLYFTTSVLCSDAAIDALKMIMFNMLDHHLRNRTCRVSAAALVSGGLSFANRKQPIKIQHQIQETTSQIFW